MLSLPTCRKANSPRCANTRLSIFNCRFAGPGGIVTWECDRSNSGASAPYTHDAYYLTRRLQSKLMSTNPFPLVPPDPDEVPETQTVAPRPRPSNEEIAAWVIFAGLFFFVMFRHLVPGVVGGLVLYLILDRLSRSFSKRMPGTAARPLALILVTLVGGGVMVGVIALLVSYVRHHVDNIPAIMTKMSDILQSTRAWLGGDGEGLIPGDRDDAHHSKTRPARRLRRGSDPRSHDRCRHDQDGAGRLAETARGNAQAGRQQRQRRPRAHAHGHAAGRARLLPPRHASRRSSSGNAQRGAGAESRPLRARLWTDRQRAGENLAAQYVADSALRARGAAAVRTTHPVRD